MSKSRVDDSAASKAEKEAGKLAARKHDEINFVLVSGLMATTAWCFIAYDPFNDALEAHAGCSASAAATKANDSNSVIFFWLADWKSMQGSTYAAGEAAPAYWWLTVSSLAYAVFDMLYMLWYPACTTRLPSLLVHHTATAVLTVASLHLKAEPLTALCMLVEVNTFLLTIKNLNRAPKVSQGGVRDLIHTVGSSLYFQPVCEPFFYFSWVFFRLFFYPFLLLTFHRYFSHPCFGPTGYAIVIGPLSILNVLNQWWTLGGMGAAFTGSMAVLALVALSFC